MATIKDVAKLAGVSVATVSRVINGLPGASDATRERVLLAIDQLGYGGNMIASSLRKQSSNVILVVVPEISNPFFSMVVEGIEEEALKAGYNMILGATHNDPRREEDFIKLIQQRGVDGAIFASAVAETSSLALLSRKFPIVLACQYVADNSLVAVSIDNVRAAMDATLHLISLGHRRIAYITGPSQVIVTRDRVRGYRMALESSGIPFDESLVVEGDFRYDSGYRAMERLLDQGHSFTAAFVNNDEMAMGSIHSLQSRGLRVPHDISIVGFDNVRMSEVFSVPLTTVAQPTWEIGIEAMRQLAKMLRGQPVERTHIKMNHELICRASSGPVKGGEQAAGAT